MICPDTGSMPVSSAEFATDIRAYSTQSLDCSDLALLAATLHTEICCHEQD